MIGKRIEFKKIKYPREAGKIEYLLETATILDKVRSVNENYGEIPIAEDFYLCLDSDNLLHLVLPLEIIQIHE